MLNDKEIAEIMKIKGMARGVVFHTDAEYILEKKGKAGLKLLEEEIKKTGQSISYGKEISATSWYPLGWRVLSLLVIKDIFNWGDKEIIDMGFAAPKHSFIVKTILRYFISIEKTFSESAKYWEKHYSVGKLWTPDINVESKRLVIRVKDFKIHPILCTYYNGYFKAIAGLVVKSEAMTIEETKCDFKDGPYHEFIINWQ